MFLSFKRLVGIWKKRVGAPARSQQRRRARPGLESLENRVVPSTFDTVVSPNGWHTAFVEQSGSYFQVFDVSKGASTLNFTPLGSPVTDYSSPVTTAVNSPPQFSIDSSTLTFTIVTGTNASQQFTVPLTNPTSISLAESAASSIFGQSVKYTAIVTTLPGTPLPTAGSVGFYVDGSLVGYGSLNGSNTASYTLNSLSAGTHSVTAEDIGNAVGYYASQMSAPVTQSVAAAGSVTTLAESMASSIFGQAVALTATVHAATTEPAAPTGSVGFYDNGTLLGTGSLNASGQAVLSVASLPAGANSLVAQYTGNANFSVSQSAALGETVTPASTTLALNESAGSSVYGQTVSFGASVSPVAPGVGTPSGPVSFFDNGHLLGTVNLNASGQAVLSIASLLAGSHAVTASYAGTSNFTGSRSPIAVSETVNLALSTPSLPAEIAGQTYSTTLSATGGSGHYSYSLLSGTLPTGMSLSSAGVVSGVSTIASSYTFTVKATDTSLGGVAGAQTYTLIVNPAAPAVITVSAPSSATAGVAIPVTITATDAYGNKANGALTLTSSDGQSVTPAVVTLSNGAASASVVLDTADAVTLTAADGTAKGVSGTIAVSPGALAKIGVSTPSTVTAGTPFTVTITVADAFGNAVSSYNGNLTLYGENQMLSVVTLTRGLGTGQVKLDYAGSVALTAIGTGASGTSKAFTVTAATPIVTVHAPTVVTAGAAFGVTVNAVDQFGNGYSGPVTLTSSDGQKVVLSTSTVSVAYGSVMFPVTLDTVNKLTLTATVDGVSTASSSISVVPNAVASFVVTAPSTATAGTPFTIGVTGKDAFGNVTTNFTVGAAVLSSDGQAVTPGVVVLTQGVGTAQITLDKTGSVMLNVVYYSAKGSSSITINPSAATSFAVSAPATAVAGTGFNVTITAHDTFGNVAAGYNGSVTLTSSDGQTVSPGTVTLTNGVATVPVTLDTVHTATGGAVTLTATASAGKGVSNYITVSPGAPAVVTLSAPSTATAGTGFLVNLKATDAFGNVVTSPATLTSSDGQTVYVNPVTVVNGAATAAVYLHTSGRITLTATVGTATAKSSGVTVNSAGLYTFQVSPPGSETAGTAFNVTVMAKDVFGNTVTSFNGNVTLYSSDQQKVLASSPITLTNGAGTGPITLDIAHTVQLVAVGGGVSGVSGLTTVSPAAPSAVKVLAPTVVQAGVAFGVTVEVFDQYGNGCTGSATLSASDGQTVTPGSVNVVNGYATFAVTLDTADKLTLSASLGGVSAASSSMTAIPSGLASFIVTAPSTATVGTGFNVTVTAKDIYGNTITGYTGPAYLLSSDGQTVSPTYVELTNGVGSAKVTLNKADTVALTAILNGVKGVSGNIVVSAV